jgi:hypothetical protein
MYEATRRAECQCADRANSFIRLKTPRVKNSHGQAFFISGSAAFLGVNAKELKSHASGWVLEKIPIGVKQWRHL